MSNRILTDERVTTIFRDCLFKGDEDTSSHIRSAGIMMTVGFHPGRLEGHAKEIVAMLHELPDTFLKSKGGGWSFLNACMDRHGNQWTDFHRTMDLLFMLGMAIQKVECPAAREDWSRLPGGMPYYIVLD